MPTKIGKKFGMTSPKKWGLRDRRFHRCIKTASVRDGNTIKFWVKDNIVVYAGIRVLAGIEKAFGPGLATEGIQITITDAEHAKLPETRPSTLD